MNRTFLILALALAACEGEPPKTASSAVVTGPAPAPEPVQTEPAATAEAPAPAAPAAPGVAMCPCACACGAGGPSAALDGGAAPLAQADAAPAAPAAPAKANITGTVTSTPKFAASAAVVYLEDAPIEPNAKMSVTIDNHMMTFSPYVAVIPVGGKVMFHNSDPFPHNVFSPDNEKFNIGVIPQNATSVRSFKTPGAYTVLCNLHPGMIGYVVATPSSYYAKVDGKGHFTIKDVPPGTYKVTAWAPRVQTQTLPATVKDGDVTLSFELHR